MVGTRVYEFRVSYPRAFTKVCDLVREEGLLEVPLDVTSPSPFPEFPRRLRLRGGVGSEARAASHPLLGAVVLRYAAKLWFRRVGRARRDGVRERRDVTRHKSDKGEDPKFECPICGRGATMVGRVVDSGVGDGIEKRDLGRFRIRRQWARRRRGRDSGRSGRRFRRGRRNREEGPWGIQNPSSVGL